MKKLKISVAVLACILASISFSLSSCVDDKESSSVANIREAHTEQLKAEAALSKAMAEAETIRAQADAALSAAKVKQVEAEAKLAEADVKIKEATAAQIAAKTESEKLMAAVNLEMAKTAAKVAETAAKAAEAEANLAIETAKLQLEQVKVIAETEMLALQEQLEKAKKALELEKGNDPVLAKAIDDYARELRIANNKVIEIARINLDIQQKEALLASQTKTLEEKAKVSINYAEQEILSSKKNIANHEKTIANYKTLLQQGGAVDIEAQIEKLDKEIADMVYNKSVGELKKRDDAEKVYDDAREVFLDFRNGLVENELWQPLLPTDVVWGGVYRAVYFTLGELNISLSYSEEYLVDITKSLTKAQKEFDTANAALEPAFKVYKGAELAANNALTTLDEKSKARDKVYADPLSTLEQKTAADAAVTVALADRDAKMVLAADAYSKYDVISIKVTSSQKDVALFTYYKQNAESTIKSQKQNIAKYESDLDMPKKKEAELLAVFKTWEAAYIVYNEFQTDLSALKQQRADLGLIRYQNGYISPDQINAYIKTNERDIERVNADIIALEGRIAEEKAGTSKTIANLKLNIEKDQNELKALTLEESTARAKALVAKAIIDAKNK